MTYAEMTDARMTGSGCIRGAWHRAAA